MSLTVALDDYDRLRSLRSIDVDALPANVRNMVLEGDASLRALVGSDHVIRDMQGLTDRLRALDQAQPLRAGDGASVTRAALMYREACAHMGPRSPLEDTVSMRGATSARARQTGIFGSNTLRPLTAAAPDGLNAASPNLLAQRPGPGLDPSFVPSPRSARTGVDLPGLFRPAIVSGPEMTPPSAGGGGFDENQAIANDLMAKMDAKADPDASGVGDFNAVFTKLRSLDAAARFQVLGRMDRAHLENLRANTAYAQGDQQKFEVSILAVMHGRGYLSQSAVEAAHRQFAALPDDQKKEVADYLSAWPEHTRNLFTIGAEAEIDRLSDVLIADLHKQRTTLAAVVNTRSRPPNPTTPWDALSDAEKKNWTEVRAPAAFQKVLDSIRGTPLEAVMRGKTLAFDAQGMFKIGGYAAQNGTSLTCSMQFIKDIEADPRNVYPILAHEMGGHFEYGPNEYAKQVINRVLDKLPPDEAAAARADPQRLYISYGYRETEVFAGLCQRRYDLPPGGGPPPIHGAVKADDVIRGNLASIAALPRPLALAILSELSDKVQASPNILDRDKKFFDDEVAKLNLTP